MDWLDFGVATVIVVGVALVTFAPPEVRYYVVVDAVEGAAPPALRSTRIPATRA